MGNWELVGGADLLNAKSPGTIASMKILEPVDGNTRGAGHKLEQSGLLLVVKTLNSLEGEKRKQSITSSGEPGAAEHQSSHLPEELDSHIIRGVLAVIGVGLPVGNVNLVDTTNEQLQLTGIKDLNEVLRDDLE